MNFKLTLLLLIASIAFALNTSRAQNPLVIVQAASPAPVASTSTTTAPAAATDSGTTPVLIKLLEAMRATNSETLKKQEAVLQQLDELQKAAEQMKAFSKRG
jgi:hypothetical protein